MNKTLVIATDNPGKLKELQAGLGRFSWQLIPQSALGITSVEETGLSFIENAILKARHASQQSQAPSLADDSGLCVQALDGAPGIYSARYSGKDATMESNIAKLLDAMKSIPDSDRAATFYCAMAFVRHAWDPTPLIGLGMWHGSLLRAPVGTHGFGYDPIFYVPTHHMSAAELSPELKLTLSHRALALASLAQQIEMFYDK